MKPTFYDTDCLSCFIVIDDTSILEEQLNAFISPLKFMKNLIGHIYNFLKIGLTI